MIANKCTHTCKQTIVGLSAVTSLAPPSAAASLVPAICDT